MNDYDQAAVDSSSYEEISLEEQAEIDAREADNNLYWVQRGWV